MAQKKTAQKNETQNIDFDCVMDSREWRLKIEQFMLK